MNLILANELSLKNRIRIINAVSKLYPYENVDHIYNFFIETIFDKDVKYILSNVKGNLYGIGINKEGQLSWPLIPVNQKYFGNHKPSQIDCPDNIIEIYKKFLVKVLDTNNQLKIYLSNYGIEELLGRIFLELNFKKYLVSHLDYFGEAATKSLGSIKDDKINYQQASDFLKKIRNNPEEKIYIYAN